MDGNAKFTFINGPTVKSISSKDDRSSVRSWFLRRTFEDRRKAALNAKSGRKRNLLPSSCEKQRRSPKKEILDEEDSESINELKSKHAIIASEDSAAQVLKETSDVSTDGIKSPKSQLLFWGNQRSDPFAPKYIPDMDNNHDRLIDHCMRVLWPGFRRVDSYAAQFYQTWVPRSLQSPHLLNSILFCASNHTLTLTNRGLCPREEQLRYRGRALESLRTMITNDNCDIEALIMSSLVLSLNDGVYIHGPIAGISGPFTPPLQSLQWLDNYASREVHPLHWAAVESLVCQLGGIRNLKSFGLPWLLSFAGLLKSSKDFSRPCYPLLAPDGQPFEYNQCIALVKIETPFTATRPSGFQYFSELGLPLPMWEVFIDLSNLSNTIRAYHCGLGPRFEVDRIADCRNLIQHRLLSLPRNRHECWAEIPTKEINDATLYLFLACCSTALLYSTHVTFPIPCSTVQRLEALTDLQKWLQLAGYYWDGSNTKALRIMLWCTVIGGVAAKSNSPRFWAAAEVSRLSALLGLNSWVEVRDVMKSFCWMEQACDVEGHELWKEAGFCSTVTL